MGSNLARLPVNVKTNHRPREYFRQTKPRKRKLKRAVDREPSTPLAFRKWIP